MGYYVKAILGVAIMLSGAAALAFSIVRLVDIGTCGSDGGFAPVRPCPAGTEYYILAIFPALLSLIVGAGIVAARGRRDGFSSGGGGVLGRALASPSVPPAAPAPAAPSPAPVVPVDDDPLARLEKLAELRKAGVVSEEEFQRQKALLLRGT